MRVYYVNEDMTRVTDMAIGQDSAFWKDSELLPKIGEHFSHRYAPTGPYNQYKVLDVDKRFTSNSSDTVVVVKVKFETQVPEFP